MHHLLHKVKQLYRIFVGFFRNQHWILTKEQEYFLNVLYIYYLLVFVVHKKIIFFLSKKFCFKQFVLCVAKGFFFIFCDNLAKIENNNIHNKYKYFPVTHKVKIKILHKRRNNINVLKFAIVTIGRISRNETDYKTYVFISGSQCRVSFLVGANSESTADT